MSSTRGVKTVKPETEGLTDSSNSTEQDNSIWVKETHIHDQDGCYDLMHCVEGRSIGQYRRKMFNEGNFLKNQDLKCKSPDAKPKTPEVSS